MGRKLAWRWLAKGKAASAAATVLMIAVLLTAGLLLPAAASAQSVIYKKYTVVDFGDDTVEGDLSRPDGAYLESRKRLRHQRLIRIRQDFRQEILQSIQLL